MRRPFLSLAISLALMMTSYALHSAASIPGQALSTSTSNVSSDAINAKSKYIGTWELSVNDGNGDIRFLLKVTESGDGLKAEVTGLDGKSAGIDIKSCQETKSGALSIYLDAAGYSNLDVFLTLDSKDSNKISGSVMGAAPVSGTRKK